MSDIKIFRIIGEITHPKMRTKFVREVRALKAEHALEKIYSELGSRHKIKRVNIRVTEVREIKPEEATDRTIRKLLGLA